MKPFLIFALFLFVGCKSIETVTVPEIHTVYQNTVKYDSIYLHDSILLQKIGDTVYLQKIKYMTKYSILHDTFTKTDTITVVKIVKGDEVVKKYTPKWAWWTLLIVFFETIWIFRKQLIKIFAKFV